jgi:5-methylcytosine-specific restriction protein A
MPTSPLSLCLVTGCPTLVPRGKCVEHTLETRRESDARRPNGYQRGWSSEWSAFSKDYLARHPQCECDECTQTPPWKRPTATDVDHTGGHSRTCSHALMDAHVQALTHAHHARKTATEDGGFGRDATIRRCRG